jgi:predicted glycogen debranching enzyme
VTPIDEREWLETDGLGGFASGTVSGVRTRRYHALLVHATNPPAGRMVLVNGFDARVDLDGAAVHLSTQRYAPDVLHPDGASRLDAFTIDPWPTWTWRIAPELSVTQEVLARHGLPGVVVRWRLISRVRSPRPGSGQAPRPGSGQGGQGAVLRVRPFLSGRDFHALHLENSVFDFTPHGGDEDVRWHPYPGVPGVRSRSNGRYRHAPQWYRRFLYTAERDRGLDALEDLASPGEISWDLTIGDAVWLVEPAVDGAVRDQAPVVGLAYDRTRKERSRRESFPSRLHMAADQFLVRRGSGRTVIAGYPWFDDWGRDTFIALRGLYVATGRLAEARDILTEWAAALSAGMLPNRFSATGAESEFDAVDASLWFVMAVHDLLRASARRRVLSGADRVRLMLAVDDVLRGYAAGKSLGIRIDRDGLLAAGVPGLALTWMDAKVDGTAVTARIGKPVEIQALWLNALAFAGSSASDWKRLFDTGMASFERRFWNEARGCLFDVVDADHVAGRVDDRIRPNQIFAIGGLPVPLLTGERARRVVDLVERELLTPVGLRTLAPRERGYAGRCEGAPAARDQAYHQGTAWPWLMGPFVDAWIRVRGGTREARDAAQRRFVQPLVGELDRCGLGHLYEIADGDAPHTPRGCPFQAWSLGELLRLLEP